MKKYIVWVSINQAYKVKAKNKEEAREMVYNGEVGNEAIVEEENQEWLSTEEVK